MLKKYVIWLLPVLFSFRIFAQQTRQYSFTHFSSFNGLASNLVNNILQDKNGFIWIAGIDGLQRYDGNKFLSFRNQPGNFSSVPSGIISKVMEDRSGNLWIWAGEHAGIFNTSNFTYTDISLEGNSDKQPNHILFLDEDMKGNAMVFVHQKGLFTYNEKLKRFQPSASLPGLFSFISYHHEPASPYLFFSGMPGIAIYDFRTGNLNYDAHNPDKNPLLEKIKNERSVMQVHGIMNDVFWYSTWDFSEAGAPHIKSIDLKTGEKNRWSPGTMFNLGYTEITGSLFQRNGKIWFYGKTFIIEYTGNRNKPFNLIRSEYKDEQSIKYDKISSMFEDAQNNLWIACDNGIFLFNPEAQAFGNYNLVRSDGSGSIDGPTASAIQLKDGRVIVGAWGSGLYIYDNHFNVIDLPQSLKNFREPYSIWCLHQQKQTGLVWMGVQGGSIIVYDPVSGRTNHFYPSVIEGSTVRQVAEDHDGNLWFGMQGGHIVKWDKKLSGGNLEKGYVVVRAKGPGFINKLFTDGQGYVWAATEGFGVFKYDPATNKELLHLMQQGSDGKRIWGNLTNDIIQYNDSLIFIAGGAINVINTRSGEVSFITNEQGLPSNTVYSFQKDKNGLLWLGMAHGLAQFNVEKGISTVYDRRDGLRYDNFMQAGAFTMNDGRLIFITEHSFTAFDPAKLFKAAQQLPPVVITDFKLANRSLSLDSLKKLNSISLRYDNTAIVVEFNCLNYTGQKAIHYFYMLEGVDKSWQQANDLNQAVYSHLPSGSFRFILKAENANGIQSETIQPFTIKVKPPFWKTWWFLGLVVLALIGLFIWLDKQRIQKLRAMESIRTRIATSLTEDMSNSLSSINIASELARMKVDNDKERTKEYIARISETSNRMVHAMYDMVWSIDPKNDNMEDVIDRMKTFATEMESLHDIDIVFDIDQEAVKLDLDMQNRYELLSIFKESIDNSIKHAGARHIQVIIRMQGPRFFMIVEDDGKGFETDEITLTRGINDMKRRAANINATFHIESEKNTGTVVKVEMPV